MLSSSELVQPIKIESVLGPGVYSVKYQVDFQDGSRPTQGVTDLVVGNVRTAAKVGPADQAGPAKP